MPRINIRFAKERNQNSLTYIGTAHIMPRTWRRKWESANSFKHRDHLIGEGGVKQRKVREDWLQKNATSVKQRLFRSEKLRGGLSEHMGFPYLNQWGRYRQRWLPPSAPAETFTTFPILSLYFRGLTIAESFPVGIFHFGAILTET